MVSGGEEGPDSQQLGLGPGAVGEQRREGGQGGYDFGRQIQGIISGSMAPGTTIDPGQRPLGSAGQLGQNGFIKTGQDH